MFDIHGGFIPAQSNHYYLDMLKFLCCYVLYYFLLFEAYYAGIDCSPTFMVVHQTPVMAKSGSLYCSLGVHQLVAHIYDNKGELQISRNYINSHWGIFRKLIGVFGSFKAHRPLDLCYNWSRFMHETIQYMLLTGPRCLLKLYRYILNAFPFVFFYCHLYKVECSEVSQKKKLFSMCLVLYLYTSTIIKIQLYPI